MSTQIGCSSLLYYPTREQHFDPVKAGTHPKDIWFQSEDGTKLHGWYFKSPKTKKPKALIVFFHGNAENISTHFAALLWILQKGYDYFIFDYRGYGKSEGKPSPEGTVLDGRAAIRWAHNYNKKIPLVVFGQSLGGAIAMRSIIDLKREIPIKLVAVESTFHSYQSEGAKVLSGHWLTWLFQPLAYLFLSDKYVPEDEISKISPTPILVMHGDQDRTVPIELGEKVFELAGEPKTFWRIPGGYHIDSFWRHDGKYRNKFLEHLTQVLAR